MPLAELRQVIRRAFSLRTLRVAMETLYTGPISLIPALRNRFSKEPITGDTPAVVSLTSYGSRLSTVHLTIECIARGSTRPQRLILWTESEDLLDNPPSPLKRLVSRGLEIKLCTDYGPHKKYFPYVTSAPHHRLPLVTADDDALYDHDWLTRLITQHQLYPHDVIAYRTHLIALQKGEILPYAKWGSTSRGMVSHRVFATGCSGVLYPPELLEVFREAGDAFLECAPRADDVWLHALTLRAGAIVRPIDDGSLEYRSLPGTQLGGLRTENIFGGGNDRQIKATYSPEDIHALWQDNLKNTTTRR